MREGIHPKWYPEAKVICACGTTWTVGSTRPTLNVDICSACHPFYTGEQRMVDTEGQVDRFMKRLEVRDTRVAEAAKRGEKTPLDLPISELNLGRQYTEVLVSNGIKTFADFLAKLEEGGDEAILEIRGIGRKVLTDAKKRLRSRGYALPVAQEAE